MSTNSIAHILSGILFSLSVPHFYWALGGEKGFNYAIPSKDGKSLFKPSPLASLTVAVALSLASVIILESTGTYYGIYKWVQAPLVFYWGRWSIVVVFFARAIGEFNYVGFFKKNKESQFASLDTRFYSPLCLFIAIGAFLLNMF
ncbi:MAG: DUF3995 domain-containing protein [Chloroflexi bacterium]|nr:DUF3995 domain-containing protein [Chloroflexota bacterium]